jgi:hypothetical protein
MGRFDDALKSFQKAVEIKHDLAEAHFNMSLTILLSGDLKAGWEKYEWRRKLTEVTGTYIFKKEPWRGEDVSGKRILLYGEQGFGDTLQFIRYAGMLSGRGAEVYVECQPELVSLLSDLAGISCVVGRGAALPEYDYHCPILSLPGFFGTEIETIPAAIPYISVSPVKLSSWRDRLRGDGSRLKVGLSWAGRPTHKKDHYRSLSLSLMSPLGGVAGVTFYSLQKGEASLQSVSPPSGMKLVDYTSELGDFSDTAGLLGNLDLVISVDTAVVHLAGAMGKRVWTLLPYAPDWRWLLGREDSPWYPTMRLFRQPAPGDWQTVIAQVAASLSGYR